MTSAKHGMTKRTLSYASLLTACLKENTCGLVCRPQPLCAQQTFDVIAERSFGDDEEAQAEAEGSGKPREEIKIPSSTLDPDLQTFCKLIFNSE